MTKHVNMMSGGLFSWATGRRVANRYGTDNLIHLFTDTKIEDDDLYRFLPEAVEDVGGELVWIAEGRTPWQVFNDEGMIGNSQADICSRILKRDLADKWLSENCDPANTIIYIGIGWDEAHRFDDGEGGGAKNRYARLGWHCEAPMLEPPYWDKDDLIAELRRWRIAAPRLYREGFPHNNCGGACIKAGQGQWAHLLRVRPAVYAEWEREETAFRERTGKDVSILRARRGGETKPWSLRDFREHVQADGQFDLFDIGGCGCFVEDSTPPVSRRSGSVK